MKVIEALETLEKSWSREDVILKLKNGFSPENIVNEFFRKNKKDIEELSKCLGPQDKKVLKHIEQLSTCEVKIVNQINNLSTSKPLVVEKEKVHNNTLISEQFSSLKLRLFMMNWSNRFVVIFLITISAIALTKQAWA